MIKYLSAQSLKKFAGKTCLLRVDLNVEIGVPLDSYRLEAIIPTVKLLLKNKIKVVILSHRGRPALKSEGKLKGLRSDWDFNEENRKLSLRPFARTLSGKLKTNISFIPYEKSWIINKKGLISKKTERVFLLENLRFYHGEEANDSHFAGFLAQWGDFYVNDAFAVSHRANASVAAITKFLPSYAGPLMEREMKNLDKAMKSHSHPFTVIIGGAKIADKLGIIKNFWNKADSFLIGGGPANTFLKMAGVNIGGSLVDKHLTKLDFVRLYLGSQKIHLPSDLKWMGNKILDVGPQTTKEYSAVIEKSRMIIWNGPMGWFERKGFDTGTKGIWKAVLANKKSKIVIGGGETITSLDLLTTNYKLLANKKRGLFLSTGGGAMLEYLSGKKLPGIETLRK